MLTWIASDGGTSGGRRSFVEPRTSSLAARLRETTTDASGFPIGAGHGTPGGQIEIGTRRVALIVWDATPSGNASWRWRTLLAGSVIAAYDAPPRATKRASVATTLA